MQSFDRRRMLITTRGSGDLLSLAVVLPATNARNIQHLSAEITPACLHTIKLMTSLQTCVIIIDSNIHLTDVLDVLPVSI
ncbi:hypothetical protein M422DRAFT_28965, partial [Sphaerobolus stellatus SS14]